MRLDFDPSPRHDRGVRGVRVFLVLALALTPAIAAGQIYRWVDERGVVHYVEGLDSVPQRYRATAQPLRLPKSPSSPTTPAGGMTPGITKIAFTPGSPILVSAKLNGSGPVALILDTGADRTVVAPGVLQKVGVSLTPVRRTEMKGVTGTVEVDLVQVGLVEVGEAKAGPLLVAAHDAEIKGADGLLGRDFLDQFKVTIDATEKFVTIAPK